TLWGRGRVESSAKRRPKSGWVGSVTSTSVGSSTNGLLTGVLRCAVVDAHRLLSHGTHCRVASTNAQMDTPRREAIQGRNRGDLHRWQACATNGGPRGKP